VARRGLLRPRATKGGEKDFERRRTMAVSEEGCCGEGNGRETGGGEPAAGRAEVEHSRAGATEIVDYKVTMLIAAGAAMGANCEMCLNKIVPDLIEAGVAESDIRRAVEIGQFVKDKPAAIMKEAADMLTGSRLSRSSPSEEEGCPADAMRRATACG
jgi:hypothetical protein